VVLAQTGDIATAQQILAGLADGAVEIDDHTRRLTAPVVGGASVLMEALRQLDAADIAILDVALRRPTLDDVFLTLTGRPPEDIEAAAGEHPQPSPAKRGSA